MSREAFIDVNFRQASLELLSTANEVIRRYQRQGLRLTLRQLYYQLVSQNVISNTERSYENLGNLLSRGRLAGYVDWDAIEDRIRRPLMITEWSSPEHIMRAVMYGYKLPRWKNQDQYVELWVEKDALAGVLQPITEEYHVTLMVNRGYSSQSAMKEAAERLQKAAENGKELVILYIGDMDPSGEDMVRDVGDRLELLTHGESIEVIKLAITPEHIAQYNPPPNPTKLSDSRAAKFIAKFGNSSYEADALPPDVLAQIVRDALSEYVNQDAWDEISDKEAVDKDLLQQASDWVMEQRENDDGEEE